MLGGDRQLRPLRERGCHDRVEAFVYVCIYMRAVVLRGPAALPVLLDPTDPVEPIQPHGIGAGPHLVGAVVRLQIVARIRRPAPTSIPLCGTAANPRAAHPPRFLRAGVATCRNRLHDARAKSGRVFLRVPPFRVYRAKSRPVHRAEAKAPVPCTYVCGNAANAVGCAQECERAIPSSPVGLIRQASSVRLHRRKRRERRGQRLDGGRVRAVAHDVRGHDDVQVGVA